MLKDRYDIHVFRLLLKFKFDATVPCTINVYFIATEIIAKNGSST